ncbi:MAG: four helix bundle protein [Pyrinomonadaceae bacterium]
MATILRFEDIDGWKMARELTKDVYSITANGSFAQDYGLRDQIRRAAVSVMSNIAEGFERDGNKEFCNFLSIAKGSVAEVRSQLYVALDQGYISESEFQTIYVEANDNGRVIAGLMKYLRSSDVRGLKFKQNEKPETRN